MKSNRKLILFLICSLLIMLACDLTTSLDPSDERLIEPSQNLIENWQEFFGDFGGSPYLSAPTIETLYPTGIIDSDTGKWEYSITIINWFYDYVGIFEVEPLGCGDGGQPRFRIVRLNQTVQKEFPLQRQLLRKIYLRPNTFITVAGSNNLENYGKYNELLRLAHQEEIWYPTVVTPDQQADFYSAPISFSGTAIPGMCLELLNNDVMVDQVAVDQNGNWNFRSINLLGGENDVIIRVANVDPRTARSVELNLRVYEPPQAYDRDNWPLIDPLKMPNLWRNINLTDIPIISIPNHRDPEVTIAIIHQFQVDIESTTHRYGFGGDGANHFRCNIFAGDVMQAMSIPFPTKNQVNCCGGGNMWVGPDFMYEFMSGSPNGIANIGSIWSEWGTWELVYDSNNPSVSGFDQLLTHLRLGKPALVSRPDHIAVLRPDKLPDRLSDDNILTLHVAQAGNTRSNSLRISEAFASSSTHALRIFIHE